MGFCCLTPGIFGSRIEFNIGFALVWGCDTTALKNRNNAQKKAAHFIDIDFFFYHLNIVTQASSQFDVVRL